MTADGRSGGAHASAAEQVGEVLDELDIVHAGHALAGDDDGRPSVSRLTTFGELVAGETRAALPEAGFWAATSKSAAEYTATSSVAGSDPSGRPERNR